MWSRSIYCCGPRRKAPLAFRRDPSIHHYPIETHGLRVDSSRLGLGHALAGDVVAARRLAEYAPAPQRYALHIGVRCTAEVFPQYQPTRTPAMEGWPHEWGCDQRPPSQISALRWCRHEASHPFDMDCRRSGRRMDADHLVLAPIAKVLHGRRQRHPGQRARPAHRTSFPLAS